MRASSRNRTFILEKKEKNLFYGFKPYLRLSYHRNNVTDDIIRVNETPGVHWCYQFFRHVTLLGNNYIQNSRSHWVVLSYNHKRFGAY